MHRAVPTVPRPGGRHARARRALRFAAALVLALIVLPASARAAELMPWDQDGDFASVLARAKKAQKLVFVDFYATWCGPCKMMDRNVYSDSVVAKVAAGLVNRKVDAEKGEGIALAQKYRIEAYPTLVIVDATGAEVARETGYRPADRFVRFLDDARSGRGTIAGLEKMIAQGKGTPENRTALGEKYAAAGRFDDAREQFDRALALDPADPGQRGADLLVSIARGRARTSDNAGAVKDAEAYATRFPTGPNLVEMLELEANAQADLGQKDSAIVTYRRIVEKTPRDPATLAGFARFCAAHGAELDTALAVAQQAVELSGGKDGAVLDALAEVYSARGQYDEAVDTAQRALDASPNQGYLRARLERFQEMAVQAVRAKSH